MNRNKEHAESLSGEVRDGAEKKDEYDADREQGA